MADEQDALKTMEARGGIEPPNKGFADLGSSGQKYNETQPTATGQCATDPVLIQLGKGFSAVVDAADYGRVAAIKWHPWLAYKGIIYARGKVEGKQTTMHRFILGLSDHRTKVDHRDGDGLNNRRSNIRAASDAENSWNRRTQKGKRTAIAKGVYRHTKGKFHAQIMVDGRRIHLGLHSTEAQAASAYDAAALKYHGEFARTNQAEGRNA